MSHAHQAPRPQHRRSRAVPILGLLALLALAFIIVNDLWTDRLWFAAIGFPQVFSIGLWTEVALFAVFGLLMAGAVLGSTAVAYRLRPPRRGGPVASELLERYRDALESRFVQIMVGVGVIVGIIAGIAAASALPTYLAWAHRTPFGITEPQFGHDVAFYVFELPWWRFVVGFLVSMGLFSTLAAALVHYVMGALRVTRNGPRRDSGAAQAHLSLLLGLTALAFAANSFLGRYAYTTASNPLLTGVGYTDDHARVNGALVVAVITAICALLFFANIWLRRWMLPVTAVVLTLVSSIVLTSAYPAFVESFTVRPNQSDLEKPYIERHIAATRQAYGVDRVEVSDYTAKVDANPGQLRADAEALPGIRLIDPAVVGPTFEQKQQAVGYYTFPRTLDVGRYTIDGQPTDAVVAVRELETGGLQTQSWNNLRTVYTHGYGMVAAYGNRHAGGEPEWITGGLDAPSDRLKQPEPRVYFGEQFTEYSVVGAPAGTPPVEIDAPGGAPTTYTGRGGVPIGGWFDRIMYAARFADVNLLLSGRVNPSSRIIYNRTPKVRVSEVAPWLTIDSNAYPALVGGRIVWVVDGYTTTDAYPNSHRLSLAQATSDSRTRPADTGAADQTVTSMRNSVKAVVDAYDGTVRLYAWDEADPVLATWRKAYPDTVLDRSAIPPELLEHLRYPSDLFKVQREVLRRYHVTDPARWIQGDSQWEVPADPASVGTDGNGPKQRPYYLSIKWPGDPEPVFSQTTVFTPLDRGNMSAYLAVNADASSPGYGRLRLLRVSGELVDGPGQTFNEMVNHPEVARRLLSFRQTVDVIHGNLLTLPVGGGLLYVQPIYTRSRVDGSYPTLSLVVVRFGRSVGVGATLKEALDMAFDGDSGVSTPEDPGATGEPQAPPQPADPAAAAEALTQAEAAFTAADKALREGDLATYQQRTREAQDAVRRATRALGRG